MLVPDIPKPKLASDGDRTGKPKDARWDRREPSPFYYNKQADTVFDHPCETCEAPLHVYEILEHEEACAKIAASDGLNRVEGGQP